jgi:hypothetical protein
MLYVAKHGAPKHFLENRDLAELNSLERPS